MKGYTVDLDKLLGFIDRVAAFDSRAEAVASEVDRHVAQLKTTWRGDAADAHQEYHARWTAAADQMRHAMAELKAKAEAAHGSYSGAVQHNSAMWP